MAFTHSQVAATILRNAEGQVLLIHLYTADALANLKSGQVFYKVYTDNTGLIGKEQEQVR